MKKLIASLLTLALAVVLGLIPVLAEEAVAPEFLGGIRFGMNLDQVMEIFARPNPEIDREATRGPVAFTELEYEHVTDASFACDICFKFVDDALVAFHYDMEEGTSYEAVKAALEQTYGPAVPFSAEKLGNAKFAIDDDGDLKDCREMIEAEGIIIVLEQDRDGDMDVTYLDPAAAYINL